MRTIHAIIAIKQKLYRDLIGNMLSDAYDIRIYEESDDEIAVAVTLQRLLEQDDFSVDDPVIVITSSGDSSAACAPFTRLLTEFPEVTLIDVSSEKIRSYQMRIKKRRFRCSRTGLLGTVRECIHDPPP